MVFTCRNLVLVDLGENDFVGSIPTWIGKSLSQLMVFSFRSNKLHGDIPRELCGLVKLQILDLAHNDLVGTIPTCFSNFKAWNNMLEWSSSFSFFRYIHGFYGMYMDNAIVVAKGVEVRYSKILRLVTSMDLSHNNMSGEIPGELTSLVNLVFLNLSNNLLTGRIPSKMGEMIWLESLDMSMNQLSGEIPPSMSNLTFLSRFNLSYNNLTGPIPQGTLLQTFDAFTYVGNKLCGPPLEENCSTDGEKHGGSRTMKENWFCLSMGIAAFFFLGS